MTADAMRGKAAFSPQGWRRPTAALRLPGRRIAAQSASRQPCGRKP
ncbi:MAG: hypothetical protein Q7J38_12160 [Gallionella sp.]|nr:hypothetical protein [Gallionella sp.]